MESGGWEFGADIYIQIWEPLHCPLASSEYSSFSLNMTVFAANKKSKTTTPTIKTVYQKHVFVPYEIMIGNKRINLRYIFIELTHITSIGILRYMI